MIFILGNHDIDFPSHHAQQNDTYSERMSRSDGIYIE